jgi:glucan 1,6-alpha-glucosidase
MNTQAKWWQKAVIYQIYPRSFLDSDGDGIGDISGIISKLDYIKSLGVDAIWLSPVLKSPQDDNGYDISDYQDIDPMFGSLEQMKLLLEEANKRGLKILMDMVLNHTSDEHSWFIEAKKSRENPKHDWYVWRDGDRNTPPNEMKSVFGGSAWQWCEECEQYYLHQYSVKQPDLNWDNPQVRKALFDMMNWWVEQGAGGFRLDVIDSVAKEPDKMITAEGTNLHPYIKEMSAAVLQGRDLVTVGECWSATPETAKLWSNPDGSELSMVFQFEHICLDQEGPFKWDLKKLPMADLKRVMRRWQTELTGRGWNSLFWENHDLPRIVSRWGDGSEKAATMLATILFGMQGTPYIYQGQEIGMTNVKYELGEYRDIEIRNFAAERLAEGYTLDSVMESIHAKGRDNARTPMQWNAGENAGFTTGTPWIKVNPNHTRINVEAQEQDSNSVLNYYRHLIQLRKDEDVIRDGSYTEILPDWDNIFAYARDDGKKKLTVIANFSGETVEYPAWTMDTAGEPILGNYDSWPQEGVLRPWESVMYLR